MPKHFPPDMIAAAREPYVKMAFISDPPLLNEDQCQNCGGLGVFILFLATDGPFRDCFPMKGKVSHGHDGHWWMGLSYVFKCPDCKGLGSIEREPQHAFVPPMRTGEQMELLAQRMGA